MKWFDTFIYKCLNRARSRDELIPVESVGRKGRGTSVTQLSANKRVASSYDDNGVINFTVYSANGGKIVETVRYDDRKQSEEVHRYVIGDDADFAESLSKIVTMEYLR